MPTVDKEHPSYQTYAPLWLRMRDAVAGEDAIRARKAEYLPVPPGIQPIDGTPTRSPAYLNYLSRARYPDAVAPAVEGMVGLMERKPAEISLPTAIEYMRERATPEGLPLDALIKRVRSEVVTLGRYVLMVDVDDEGDPYIATYAAESLINWRTADDRMTLAVFHEVDTAVDPNDPFVEERVDQWRVCRLIDGVYTVQVYQELRRGDEREFVVVDERVPERQGEPFDFVPVVVIGSRDLLPEPDAVPLKAVATKSLHYFRQYADYAQQLFMSANGTTPYRHGYGNTDDADDVGIGPHTLWETSNEGASAGFIEVSGTGLDAQKQSLDEIQQEIASATIQAMSEGKRQAEAAEALRLRFQSQTATLASIASSTAEGLKRALRWAAWWQGADEEQVMVEQPTSFITDSPDAQMLTAIMDGVERGQLPTEVLMNYTRRTELHDLTDEEYARLAASLQAVSVAE